MRPEPTPHRIKGAVLAGHALQINLMSKITPLQRHELNDTTTRKNFKHVLKLRYRHNMMGDRLTLHSKHVIYIIYIHNQKSGNFKSYVGQTSGSCLSRFAEHLTAGTHYKRGPKHCGRQEGQGLYQFMQAHGMMNLAIMPLQLVDYPHDIELDQTEFLNVAKPLEHFWANTFDSHHSRWNVASTIPTDPDAAMAAHLTAKRRSRRARMGTRRTLSRSHLTPSDVTHASTAHRTAEEALTLEHISSLTDSVDSYDELPMFEDAPIQHELTFHDTDMMGEQGHNE